MIFTSFPSIGSGFGTTIGVSVSSPGIILDDVSITRSWVAVFATLSAASTNSTFRSYVPSLRVFDSLSTSQVLSAFTVVLNTTPSIVTFIWLPAGAFEVPVIFKVLSDVI